MVPVKKNCLKDALVDPKFWREKEKIGWLIASIFDNIVLTKKHQTRCF